jgi:selenium metabolism protein YedF
MTFLYLSSDKMGEGDPNLGRKLMKSFLKEIAASDVQVDMIGCVNNAVLLTTEGSEVIESLRLLEARGARIASCGTCLQYHQLEDKLLIGQSGTMAQSVQIMSQADRVICP